MKAEKFTHYTPAAMELIRAHDDNERDPIDGLELYTYGNIELGLTKDEVEEFERDTNTQLDSDVLRGWQFDKLLAEVEFEDREKISVAMAHCVAAFGDFDELPDRIDGLCRAGKLKCTTYDNDNSPSFMPSGVKLEDSDVRTLFVDSLKPEDRGRAFWRPGDPIPARYTVFTTEQDDSIYYGNELDCALAMLFLPRMTREEIGAAYEEVVGYNPFEDSPAMSTEEGRELLRSVIGEHEKEEAKAAKEKEVLKQIFEPLPTITTCRAITLKEERSPDTGHMAWAWGFTLLGEVFGGYCATKPEALAEASRLLWLEISDMKEDRIKTALMAVGTPPEADVLFERMGGVGE